MHTREKLGKQANKEQVRISSHFIVYSISRELNYKKTLQNSMLYTSVTSRKMCKNLNEKMHSKFPCHKRYISCLFASFLLLPALTMFLSIYFLLCLCPDLHFLLQLNSSVLWAEVLSKGCCPHISRQ